MKKLFFLLVMLGSLFSMGYRAFAAEPTPVPDDLIVKYNGLEWVWASPCSGGCSQPSPSQVPGGWRFATDEEFALRPPPGAFAASGWTTPPNGTCYAYTTSKRCLCAAQFFDPKYGFCDGGDLLNGYVTNTYNGGNWDMFFVRSEQSADIDGDGVPDASDNCPAAYNPDQSNSDGDATGDVCDACPLDPNNDVDGDGVCGEVDNCPYAANPGQEDTDNDGTGDACMTDIDADGDNWADVFDNCPSHFNPDQADGDGDGVGNACDICAVDPDNDADGDGYCGDVDNCPLVNNPDQTDSDADGQGNACDADDDNDAVADAAPDNCPLAANADQADSDADGQGDVCDLDADGDGFNDAEELCPGTQFGVVVNADGCSISQVCPAQNSWKNHGAYVKCVVNASADFVAAGLMTEQDMNAMVSEAGASGIGRK